MVIEVHKTVQNIPLGYSQDRIVQYLKEHDEATSSELNKLSNHQSKPLSELIEKGIVYKTKNRKYRLITTEYNELFNDFIIDVALEYFGEYLKWLEKQGITELKIRYSPRILDTYGELIPSFIRDLPMFLKDMQEKNKNAL